METGGRKAGLVRMLTAFEGFDAGNEVAQLGLLFTMLVVERNRIAFGVVGPSEDAGHPDIGAVDGFDCKLSGTVGSIEARYDLSAEAGDIGVSMHFLRAKGRWCAP
jgi:hypothetical protein